MKFEELDLNNNVLDALYDMRFDDCTPVQEKCIPEILNKRDVMGVAQTGTGKTAAYLLPILSMIDSGNYPDETINCLIMAPTRELAQQIDQAMQGFGYYLQGVSSVAVYGGNDGNRYDQELKSLKLGADVVIATPGRFISHISLGNVDLSKVSFFVLDEADRMLDMGFSDDIMTIAKKLPKTCQTIMFSATMPKKINELAQTLLKNPVEIKLAVSKPAEKIKQMAYICYETQKLGIIKDIFKKGDLKRVIVFCGAKQKVKQVSGALQRMKVNCDEMHSDLEQAARDEVMFRFKSGQTDVLVATDILSRGIDIDDIAIVINYDVPRDAEDYVHRIGRTARADRDGAAITLVAKDDMHYFMQIEKFLEKEIEKIPLPEELGEAPEYVDEGKPDRRPAKAKNVRRNDRDQTAHKHKPYRNAEGQPAQASAEGAATEGGEPRKPRYQRQGYRPKDGEQTAEAQAKKTGEQTENAANAENRNRQQQRRRNNRPQGPRPAGEGENRKAGENNGNRTEQTPRKDNENRQRRNNNRGEQAPRKDNPNSQSGDTRNANRGNQSQRRDGTGAQPRDNRNNRRPRPNDNRQRNRQQDGAERTATSTAKAAAPKQDGSIKSIIKKPLKWLKWFKK